MHVIAIDQGTTGTTAMLFDERGEIIGKAYREFRQIFRSDQKLLNIRLQGR